MFRAASWVLFREQAHQVGAIAALPQRRGKRLERRVTATEVRLATEITSLAAAVNELTGLLRSERDLRPRVERCEADIASLKAQVGQGA